VPWSGARKPHLSKDARLSSTDVLVAIAEHARTGPDRPAVKDLQRDLTYGELLSEAALVGSGLSARGVEAEDRIALFLPNSVDFVVVALACLSIGAIFVPLAVGDPPARLAVIVGDCTPGLIVISDGDGTRTGLPAGPEHTEEVAISMLRATDRDRPVFEPSPESGAYIIYTSGTTGTPNGVLIGRGAFAAAVAASASALGLDVDTRTLCVSPFHFDGSFGTVFPVLFSGGAVVLRLRDALLFPRTFFNAVVNEGITYTGFSPSYLRLLLSSPQMATLSESSLRLIALGGEASSPADVLAIWAAAPGMVVFNRYGPTEATIAVSHMKVTPEGTAAGTVPFGRPHAGVTFYLFDEEDRLVETSNQLGELYVGGNQLMIGYWGNPALTAKVFRSDLLAGETLYRTGDMVYRDQSGDYVYVDRADRVINRSGIRISLVELSHTLRLLDSVSAAACLAFDNEGQLGIVAFVVSDGANSAFDLRRAARERLPDTMLPDRIVLVESFPLTRSSKLDERRLLSEAGLQQIGPGTSPPR
jgi:D-alanine--poly(phosphoribitol) ligase subunit 1